ncbi:hypothetical protein PsB1_0868 [Candidatus Phycosocius spiralis]|uniref:2-vinyl bacteriochlorophyllide hydratase n=1 Tax=Candidatus Phycosocius spiralis TaxID=2815099 RepID=A0ABQ4PV06_9PROT|nr:hypothetical protein PsB1_0868 [Candidatus Phycosocius spiralis]
MHKIAESKGSLPFCERDFARAIEQDATFPQAKPKATLVGDPAEGHCILYPELNADRGAPAMWDIYGQSAKPANQIHKPLYTPAQRARRDASKWTLVQAILAPIQFLVFLISLGLIGHYMVTGQGYGLATMSILVKTALLYTIMITGSIWEKVVFDAWLFAEAFFWEDVFSMLVLALQTLYVLALVLGWWTPQQQMFIAMVAYATYVINAGQFLWKLRLARLEGQKSHHSCTSLALEHPASEQAAREDLVPNKQWAGLIS